MNLYNIRSDYRELFDTFDTDDTLTDDQIQAYFDTLEGIEDEFDNKGENIACFIKEINGDIDLLEAEIPALQSRLKAKKNFVKRLKTMLIENMQAIGKEKIDRPRARITLKNNPESAQIDCEKEFIKWAKLHNEKLLSYPEPTISKTAVKAALQNGEDIPGARLGRTVSVIIK